MNLLSYAGENEPSPQSIFLRPIIQDVFDTVKSRARKNDINLITDVHQSIRIFTDPQLLFRVLLNLVVNAVDACEKKGHGEKIVNISFSQDNKHAIISVKDTGEGIKPEIRDKLFQAFFTTKGSKGTGLGLACCERIIHKQGGYIQVEENPSGGSIFTVYLPLSAP